MFLYQTWQPGKSIFASPHALCARQPAEEEQMLRGHRAWRPLAPAPASARGSSGCTARRLVHASSASS